MVPTLSLKGEKGERNSVSWACRSCSCRGAVVLEGPLQKHGLEEVVQIDPDLSTSHPLLLSQYLTWPPRAGQGRVDNSGVGVATANGEIQDHYMDWLNKDRLPTGACWHGFFLSCLLHSPYPYKTKEKALFEGNSFLTNVKLQDELSIPSYILSFVWFKRKHFPW